jgi:hypothetical protein
VGIAGYRSARIWVAINVRRGRRRGWAPDRVTTERTANRTLFKARAAGFAPATFGSGGQIWRSPVGNGATRNRIAMRDLGTWHSRRCLSLCDLVFPKRSHSGGGARCGRRTFTAVSFTAPHQAPTPPVGVSTPWSGRPLKGLVVNPDARRASLVDRPLGGDASCSAADMVQTCDVSGVVLRR